MIFWRSIAIALAVILGLSYAGFAYVYSQSGGIIIGMIAGARQPKVITLLKNQNITKSAHTNVFLNTSVDTYGYKTGFLYLKAIQRELYSIDYIDAYSETDSLSGSATTLISNLELGANVSLSWEINIGGSSMRIRIISETSWAVLSMSLYLRD
jgi:hypothetical protein